MGDRIQDALTLVETITIIVVVAVLCFAGSILLPNGGEGCREKSWRLVCSSNLKGLGTSATIYANCNGGSWPIPAFDESIPVDYRIPVGGGIGTAQSPNRRQPSLSGPGGATQLSVSRSLWMIVRSGDLTTWQFLCPQSKDIQEPTKEKLDSYYDFSSISNLSYGLQVSFGRPETRSREGADNRMVFAADKGPFRDANVAGPAPGLAAEFHGPETYLMKPPPGWKPFNTDNHSNEGQSVLYADGHSEFRRTPTAGMDGDNIYTISLDNFNLSSRAIGELPWLRSLPPQSSTDSVIFP